MFLEKPPLIVQSRYTRKNLSRTYYDELIVYVVPITGSRVSNAGFCTFAGTPAMIRKNPNGPLLLGVSSSTWNDFGKMLIGLDSCSSPSTRTVNTAVKIREIRRSRVPTNATANTSTWRRIEFARNCFWLPDSSIVTNLLAMFKKIIIRPANSLLLFKVSSNILFQRKIKTAHREGRTFHYRRTRSLTQSCAQQVRECLPPWQAPSRSPACPTTSLLFPLQTMAMRLPSFL